MVKSVKSRIDIQISEKSKEETAREHRRKASAFSKNQFDNTLSSINMAQNSKLEALGRESSSRTGPVNTRVKPDMEVFDAELFAIIQVMQLASERITLQTELKIFGYIPTAKRQ